MRPLRLLLAATAGNLLGYGAWRLALVFVPWLWAGRGPASSFLVLVGLIALTAIVLAAPPVLAGVLAAWLGGDWRVWVGLVSGLWSLILLRPVPAALHLAPGIWYASTVLVLFSGAMGGWMMDLHARPAVDARLLA